MADKTGLEKLGSMFTNAEIDKIAEVYSLILANGGYGGVRTTVKAGRITMIDADLSFIVKEK